MRTIFSGFSKPYFSGSQFLPCAVAAASHQYGTAWRRLLLTILLIDSTSDVTSTGQLVIIVPFFFSVGFIYNV